MQRFERIIAILLALRAGGRLTAGDLARRLEVSERTIYRDLDLLGELGVPLYTERGRAGGIGLMPGYFLPPVTFTRGEAMSLVAGLALLHSLTAMPFAADLDTARRKLLAAVPDDLRAVLADAERILGFETPPDDIFHPEVDASVAGDTRQLDPAAVVSTFAEAVFQRRIVHLRYRSPYRPRAADIDIIPLGFFWDRQRWYLAGIPTGRERTLFRADRVLRITLGARAERPEGFDVRALLGRAWLREAMADWAVEPYLVRIRLTPPLAARLQRDWYYRHAAYEPLSDDAVVMAFGEVNRASVFELVRWLGPDAELLEPAAWRAALRDDALAMARRHATAQG